LSFCWNSCEGHSFKKAYSLYCFHRVSQKANSFYQHKVCLFSSRTRFIASDLFHWKHAEPQKRRSLHSISLLGFILNLYAILVVAFLILNAIYGRLWKKNVEKIVILCPYIQPLKSWTSLMK
jgi:hypothetical protein